MSGSAALASARRRRAIPQGPEQISNVIVDTPKPPPPQPLAANPTMLLLKHNQTLGNLQTDIESLKRQLTDIKVAPTVDANDKSNVEYYKTQHAVLLDEMREVKKTLLKIQTFAMETNLEVMKLTRLVKKDDEPAVE
jgi:hypothetical protein